MIRQPWTHKDIAILRREYPRCEDVAALAKRLRRTVPGVREAARQAGIIRFRASQRSWYERPVAIPDAIHVRCDARAVADTLHNLRREDAIRRWRSGDHSEPWDSERHFRDRPAKWAKLTDVLAERLAEYGYRVTLLVERCDASRRIDGPGPVAAAGSPAAGVGIEQGGTRPANRNVTGAGQQNHGRQGQPLEANTRRAG